MELLHSKKKFFIEKLEMNLLENALDFIQSSIDHLLNEYEANNINTHRGWNIKSMKYVVLHLSAGVDLLFKYRISKVHWSLLFQDIDKANIQKMQLGDFVSINSITCLKRLENNCEVKLEDEFVNNIKWLREKRNTMEHFKISESKIEIEARIFKIIKGTLCFIEKELSENHFSYEEKVILDSVRKKIGYIENYIAYRWKEIEEIVRQKESNGEIVIKCPKCFQKASFIGEICKCEYCNYSALSNEFARDYIWSFMGVNEYAVASRGGEYPLYICPECEGETMILDENENLSLCVSCGKRLPTNDKYLSRRENLVFDI